MFLPMPQPIPDDPDPIARLRKIVHFLRAPGGCPWDREQSHLSLVPNLLEEAYEAADAIRSGDPSHIQEELGDLLLQPIMHAEIGSESGIFNLDSIATSIADKLVRRHPHVFAESDADSSAAVLTQWDAIKRQEKGDPSHTSILHRVGDGLPALIRASKIQKKVAKVGFDWPSAREVIAKIREETAEVELALDSGDPTHLEEEIGDLLFAVVNLARKSNLDAESLLDAANQKFVRRFQHVESQLAAEGTRLEDAGLEKLESAWQAAKSHPIGSQ